MEVKVKCALCKQVRASGVWQLEESFFGNVNIRKLCLCAGCGFAAVNMKRVIWQKDSVDPIVVPRFVGCKLIKSFDTPTVKPEQKTNDEQYDEARKRAMAKFRQLRKQKSESFRLHFVSDPDFIQGPMEWNDEEIDNG